MRINIAERLKPYTHLPGTSVMIPGSFLRATIFPTLLRIESLEGAEPRAAGTLAFKIKGPVRNFTIQNDLERGAVYVFGQSADGYFRYALTALAEKNAAALTLIKAPEQQLHLQNPAMTLSAGDVLSLDQTGCSPHPCGRHYFPPETDRLSLGNHKSQDWELVKRRLSLAEILPHWLRLGQLVPQTAGAANGGTLRLLQELEEALAAGRKMESEPLLQNLFLAAFDGILSPRLVDTDHQGIVDAAIPEGFEGSPLPLLHKGAALIRSLFFRAEADALFLLPLLPPAFHCGRFLNLAADGWGTLDIEWSKKTLKKVILRPNSSRTVRLHLQNEISSFRLRKSIGDKGQVLEAGAAFTVESGGRYLLDRFFR